MAGHIEEYGELAEEVDRLGIEIGDLGAAHGVRYRSPAYARWVLGARLAECARDDRRGDRARAPRIPPSAEG